MVVVEDHVLVADAVGTALTLHGYEVRRVVGPGLAGPTEERVASVLLHRPRIVLLDLELGTFGDGAPLIEPLTTAGPAVVVLTGSADRSRWGECAHRGARAVVSKTRPLNEVLAVTRRLTQGLPVMSAREREALIATWHRDRAARRERRERLGRLTPSEREVLGHLVRGCRVSDIAGARRVSEATVRAHVRSILVKLGVSSQLAAVSYVSDADR